MRRLWIPALFLVVGMLATACGPSSSAPTGSEKQPVWLPPEQAKPSPGGEQQPTGEPTSIAKFITEWQQHGLTEDQIKFKLSDGLEQGHLPPVFQASDEELDAIKQAGASDDLIEYIRGLDLSKQAPAKAEPTAPVEGGAPPQPTPDQPAEQPEAAPPADTPPAAP